MFNYYEIVNYTLAVALYLYSIIENGKIVKGISSKIIVLFICYALTAIGFILNFKPIFWLLIIATFTLYDIFYDDEPIKLQIKNILLYGILVFILLLIDQYLLSIPSSIILSIVLILVICIIYQKRKKLKIYSLISVCTVYLLLDIMVFYFWLHMDSPTYFIISIFAYMIDIMIFVVIEIVYSNLNKEFSKSSTSFENFVLSKQYDEVKGVYLNMRGWRHDFHNHIQTMKSYMYLKNYQSIDDYLTMLDNDLIKVDTLIKSGNIMADAILNAKLTIAANNDINIDCKASIPEALVITDVDMCVIFGNLLENSIEACLQLDKNKRFIRIYIDTINNQFYMSIQNSAKEILSFNEKNYISSKRGEHGLGMKRVKLLVDKYDGFLNLKNEPGVFACEVTLPLITN